MNFIRATHLLAMDMATLADISKSKGLQEDARDLYKKAFELEKKAAYLTSPVGEDTDAYFILMRSAASLALSAGLFEEGKQLIQLSLNYKPPVWIEEELKNIAQLIQVEKENSTKTKKTTQLQGVLTDINSRELEIILKNDELSQAFSIIVPQNQFFDIVRKYWLHKVKIQVFQTQQGLFFLDGIAVA